MSAIMRQEDCDRDKAVLAANRTGLCEQIVVDDCTAAGMSTGAIAWSNLYFQEIIDQHNCAMRLETLDQAAQIAAKSPVVITALESCSWVASENFRAF